MFVAIVGYAFSGSIENGGEGLKIGFFRTQAAKIAKKTTRESTRDEEGRRGRPATKPMASKVVKNESNRI